MALRRSGGAVAAMCDGFYFFDFGTGKLELIQQVDAEIARERDREKRLGLDFRRPGSPAQAPSGGDPNAADQNAADPTVPDQTPPDPNQDPVSDNAP